MNNRIWNMQVAVAAGACIGLIFLATITHIRIDEWDFWVRASSVINLGVLLAVVTLFLVLWQIAIAQEDNELLKFTLTAEYLEFLYSQEDVASQHIKIIGMIKTYNHKAYDRVRSPSFFGGDFQLKEINDKKQRLKEVCSQVSKRMEKDQPGANRYLGPRAVDLFEHLRVSCDHVLVSDGFLREIDDAMNYWDFTPPYHRDVIAYRDEVRKMIAKLEPRKHSVFSKLFPDSID